MMERHIKEKHPDGMPKVESLIECNFPGSGCKLKFRNQKILNDHVLYEHLGERPPSFSLWTRTRNNGTVLRTYERCGESMFANVFDSSSLEMWHTPCMSDLPSSVSPHQ